MRVALLTTFNASRKEPLAALLDRIHTAFVASGSKEPSIRFAFSDAPLPGFVSSVDRVLKRYSQLERFVSVSAAAPAGPPIRQITNGPGSPAAGESVPFETLLAIAAGVPRSFPFHNLSVQFSSDAFGDAPQQDRAGALFPGVTVGDSWWVNGRMRSVSALTFADADPAGKQLPPPHESVAAVLLACGKVKTTVQVPLAGTSEPATFTAPRPAAPDPEVASAVRAVVQDYRTRFEEILDRVPFRHDLPPTLDALRSTPLGQSTGPKKPVLVQAFKPMGYNCRAGSGTFSLRRRTAGNLTVEISLDVGTWSRSLTASFRVHGPGFRATLLLPASRRAAGAGQYPIGDEHRWQQIVENLAAVVTELDRTFVPAVEAASGPAPEWFEPAS